MTAVWIVPGLIVLVLLWVVYAYNHFVKLNIRTDEAWSDIDVQLKRRYDLIPNLVEVVKGYAKHEKGIFEEVTKARAEAISAKDVKTQGAAENQLTAALRSVFAVAEAYPDLKANENFAKLQDEVTDTEDKVQAARRFYNGNVRDLNILVKSFPYTLMASVFGFQPRQLFELEEAAAREPVKVSFDEEKK